MKNGAHGAILHVARYSANPRSGDQGVYQKRLPTEIE